MRFWFVVLASAPLIAQTIPSGTHIALRLEQVVTTATTQQGDRLVLSTAAPLLVDDRVIIPEGARAAGEVLFTRRSPRVKGHAELALRLLYIVFPSGEVWRPKDTIWRSRVNDDPGGAAAKTIGWGFLGVGAGVIAGAALASPAGKSEQGAAVGTYSGLTFGILRGVLPRGKEVDFPVGTVLDFVMP